MKTRKLIARWWRDSVRARGAGATLREFATEFLDIARDLTPERRRARFGDLDYDIERNVDTTWSNVKLRTRFRGLFAGSQYGATDPLAFTELREQLAINPAQYTFIDLGSGKGRAVFLAADAGFRRAIGVEILKELHNTARFNLKRYRQHKREGIIEFVYADAREFRFPPEPLVVYLFNPFPEHVFRTVFQNLERLHREAPQPVHLVIYNVEYPALADASWLRLAAESHAYKIYSSV